MATKTAGTPQAKLERWRRRPRSSASPNARIQAVAPIPLLSILRVPDWDVSETTVNDLAAAGDRKLAAQIVSLQQKFPRNGP